MAWALNYRKVRVQLDSQVAIQLLLAEGEITHQHSSEVASFSELLNRNWIVKVEHLYEEGNRVADYLAGHGHSLPYGVHFIHVSDPTLLMHILYGLFEISESHLIVNKK
ncbi:Putative ribonuclease H protein At1g65750 [Linum grandiflorum]